MSTRQQQLAEIDSPPEWLQGFDDPVIRVRGNNRNHMHRPDTKFDEPIPACKTQGLDGNYDVVERDLIEGFYDECQNPQCFGGDHE